MRADKGQRRKQYNSERRKANAIARKDATDLRNTLIDVLTFEIEDLRKQQPMPIDLIIAKQDELLRLHREAKPKKQRRKRKFAQTEQVAVTRPQNVVKETFNRKQYRKEKRRTQLPLNRICPGCDKLKLNNKQWVVIHSLGTFCKSCYWDMKKQCNVNDFANWVEAESITFDPKPMFRNALIKRFVETCKDAPNGIDNTGTGLRLE